MSDICQYELCDTRLNALAIKRGGKYCCYDCAKKQDKINAHRTRHTNAIKAERYDKIMQAYVEFESEAKFLDFIGQLRSSKIIIPEMRSK